MAPLLISRRLYAFRIHTKIEEYVQKRHINAKFDYAVLRIVVVSAISIGRSASVHSERLQYVTKLQTAATSRL